MARLTGRAWLILALAAAALTGLGSRLAAASIAGCPVLPADNIWNARVDTLPVHPLSDAYIASIGAATALHPDFGAFVDPATGEPIGIPFTLVSTPAQPFVPIVFTDFGGESDPGPYPIPPTALIEGGPNATGDRHVLVIDTAACVLYELFNAFPQDGGASWAASSGAKFDLRSNALRPDGFTSADAAGLPIFPGLVRLDEADSGEIRHAFRFTARVTQQAHVWPARHDAGSTMDPGAPPMGQRFRLKAAVDLSPFTPRIRAIFQAFKTYGLILADNGSNWFVSGTQDSSWNDDELVSAFAALHGSDFEAVDVSSLLVDPNSGQAAVRPRVSIATNSSVYSAGGRLVVTVATDPGLSTGSWYLVVALVTPVNTPQDPFFVYRFAPVVELITLQTALTRSFQDIAARPLGPVATESVVILDTTLPALPAGSYQWLAALFSADLTSVSNVAGTSFQFQ